MTGRWRWGLVIVAHLLTFLAGAIVGPAVSGSQVEQVERAVEAEQQAVIAHRIRNEASHDCSVRFLRDIVAAITAATQGDQPFIAPEDDCPPPLTENEIRGLIKEGDQ